MSGMHMWRMASGWNVMETTVLLMGELKLGKLMLGNSERMEDHWS